LARILKEAFHIARSGRLGPVLVDIPKNVPRAWWNSPAWKKTAAGPSQILQPHLQTEIEAIAQGGDLIKKAKRPVDFRRWRH
jgi:thiamine pyrophosphate-dependent acetolactate synthase large subunit-like protein